MIQSRRKNVQFGCANLFFNEFEIMIKSVNIESLFVKLVNWKPLHALMKFKCTFVRARAILSLVGKFTNIKFSPFCCRSWCFDLRDGGENFHQHIQQIIVILFAWEVFDDGESYSATMIGASRGDVILACHPWWNVGVLLCLKSRLISKNDNTD